MTFVANIMFTYGVALLAAMALGLDMGMPVAGPPPMVPLSAVLGGTMLLAGALSSAEAKKGEPGFVRRARALWPATLSACIHASGAR